MKKINKEMMMKSTVTKYVADDGTEFDFESDCKEHDALIFYKKWKTLFDVHEVNYDNLMWYCMKYDEDHKEEFLKIAKIILCYDWSKINEHNEIFISRLWFNRSKLEEIEIKDYGYDDSEYYLFNVNRDLKINVLDSKTVQENINEAIKNYNSIFHKEFKQNSKEFDEIFW